MGRVCNVGAVRVGTGSPLAIIAGPCVLESLQMGLEIGRTVRDACASAGLAYVFKASFDKANRSSIDSARGPGLEKGLEWLARIGRELNVPVTTDIHDAAQAEPAARAVDLLQIPAFLCRQTDLLLAAGREAANFKRGVNVKKGQFVSPGEMAGPVGKLAEAGCTNVMLTERGTFFGYGRLVNDFLGVAEMMELDVAGGAPPVCFDCTHSTQRPGTGKVTGGDSRFAPMLARAAAAAGVHAIFLECHPEPSRSISDAATMIPLARVPQLLSEVAAVRSALERRGQGKEIAVPATGLIVVGAVGGLIALAIAGSVISLRKRRKMLESLTGEGWDVHLDPPFETRIGWYSQVSQVDAIRRHGASGTQWCIRGQVDGRTVYAMEHQFATGSGKSRTTHYNTLAWITCPQDWAALTLQGENLFTKIAEMFGKKDLQVEDAQFNKRWRILCEDEDFALVVLGPEVQALLIDSTRKPSGDEWWHVGGGVICCGRRMILSADAIKAHIRRPMELLKAMAPELREMVAATPEPPMQTTELEDSVDEDEDEEDEE